VKSSIGHMLVMSFLRQVNQTTGAKYSY